MVLRKILWFFNLSEYLNKKPEDLTACIMDRPRHNSIIKELNNLKVNNVIVEAQKKKIKTAEDLNSVVKRVLNSNQKTILLVIYNSQNQRRYIGIKLD